MKDRKPYVTAMVLYSHPSTKDRSKPGLHSPALVLRVHEDESKVDLNVFLVSGGSLFRPDVDPGDGEYEWSWPDA